MGRIEDSPVAFVKMNVFMKRIEDSPVAEVKINVVMGRIETSSCWANARQRRKPAVDI